MHFYFFMQDNDGTNKVVAHKEESDSAFKLSNASGLTHLYLSGNNFIEIPFNFFQHLPELQWLDLRRNKLERIFNDMESFNKSISSPQANKGNQEKNFLIEVGILNK